MPADELESFQHLFAWFTASILKHYGKLTPRLQALLGIYGKANMESHLGKFQLLKGWDEPIFKGLILQWNKIAMDAENGSESHERELLCAGSTTGEYETALNNMFDFSKELYDKYLTAGFDFLKGMDEHQTW